MFEKILAGIGIALMIYGMSLAVSLLRAMKDRRHRAVMLWFCALPSFFLLGYAAYSGYLAAGESFLNPGLLTSLIFFFGAVFVVLAVRAFSLVCGGQAAAIAEIRQSEEFFQSANAQMENLLNAVKNEKNFRVKFENPGLLKCWEVKKCGNQACPAYNSSELRCWQVAGTYCGGQVQGTFAQKIGGCENCEVYKKATGSVLSRMGEIFNNAVLMLEQKACEVEKAAAELEKTQEELVRAEKMSAVGQLAAGLAHEINNPIGIIMGFSQALKSRIKPGDPLFVPVEHILRETQRCKNLVKDLLTFSRATTENRNENTDVNSAVEGTVHLLQAIKDKKVVFVKEFGEGLPAVFLNIGQLQQSIVNLGMNALDAMPEGGKLTVRTFRIIRNGRDFAAVQVEDSGMGIAKEIRDKIFNPFFTTKEPGKGTGLGLSLVHEFVRKYQGMIEVESEPGKGTTVTVSFPATSFKGNL